MKTAIAFILAIAAAQVTGFGMAGVDIVVTEGQKMTEPKQVKWPAGVMNIVNDPTRTVGWHPWFSELPNAQHLFAFDIAGSADVNRLLNKLAAVQHERVALLISPDRGPGKAGLLAKEVESKIEDSALRFIIGSQALLADWYERLEETEAGVKKFGVRSYARPPQAMAPTLILFAGHPAVNLSELVVPKRIAVSSVTSAPNRQPDARTLEEVDQFIKDRGDPDGDQGQAFAEPERATFRLRHRLGSEMVDDLRQVLLGRPGQEAVAGSNNLEVTVTAPADVMRRAATFIFVHDWPDLITRGSNYTYPQVTVLTAARSFFYACSIEDEPEAIQRMLSLRVLAKLSGREDRLPEFGSDIDPDLARQLRQEWPGRDRVLQELVAAWMRYPLRFLKQQSGVAIGFQPRYFVSAGFEDAPETFVQMSFVSEGNHGVRRFLLDSLPPWFRPGETEEAASKTNEAERGSVLEGARFRERADSDDVSQGTSAKDSDSRQRPD